MPPGTGVFPRWGTTTILKRGLRDRGQARFGDGGTTQPIRMGMRPGTGICGSRGSWPLVRREPNPGQAPVPNEDRRSGRSRKGTRPDRGQASVAGSPERKTDRGQAPASGRIPLLVDVDTCQGRATREWRDSGAPANLADGRWARRMTGDKGPVVGASPATGKPRYLFASEPTERPPAPKAPSFHEFFLVAGCGSARFPPALSRPRCGTGSA